VRPKVGATDIFGASRTETVHTSQLVHGKFAESVVGSEPAVRVSCSGAFIRLSVQVLWSGAFNVGLTGACVSLIHSFSFSPVCGCGVNRAAVTICVTNTSNGCSTAGVGNSATLTRSRVPSLTRPNFKALTLSFSNLHSGTLGRYVVPRLHPRFSPSRSLS
jgi:hypothetical protein